jgi:hypothetical protein
MEMIAIDTQSSMMHPTLSVAVEEDWVLSFLDEVQALKAIRRLFNVARTAKIAVAFWGDGAVASLGLDRSGLDIDVICNLDSGACNPIEIDRLRRLGPHASVRSDPRLHGKVYWTPDGVVVGSSNASTNGLAVEIGLSGWAEANIQSNDQEIIDASLAWFETRKQNAYEITDGQIVLATQLWNDRFQSAPAGLKLAGDIGAAVRSSPHHPVWLSVKLAVYCEGFSREGRRALKEERLTNPILRGMDAYESWHDEIQAGDWLLDFEVDGSQGAFGGYWSVPTPKLETKLMTYVSKRPAVRLPGFGALTLSKSDLTKLQKAVPTFVQKFGSGESPPWSLTPPNTSRRACPFAMSAGPLSPHRVQRLDDLSHPVVEVIDFLFKGSNCLLLQL